LVSETKTLQTNIAVNDSSKCSSNTVLCHTDHSPQRWFEEFFSFT